jgi:ABC-2 type transport system ATP-binding protein
VEVRGLIRSLAQRGVTVLLSSHLLHEVQQVCTRVAILKEGMLLAQGTVSELLAAGRGIVLGFDQPERYMAASRALQEAAEAGATWLRGAQYVRPELGAWIPPGGWLLLVDAPFERAAELGALLAAQGVHPREMRQREASLEELFLTLTGALPPPPPPPQMPMPLVPAGLAPVVSIRAAPTSPAPPDGTADPAPEPVSAAVSTAESVPPGGVS